MVVQGVRTQTGSPRSIAIRLTRDDVWLQGEDGVEVITVFRGQALQQKSSECCCAALLHAASVTHREVKGRIG